MIPTDTTYKDFNFNDFEVKSEKDLPSKTYKMVINKDRVMGQTDGLDAMRQAVYKILNTERYHYKKVYGDNYGIELIDLFGLPVPYVMVVVQERIKEALLWDERVTGVTNFQVERNKGSILVRFTVKTIFGDIEGQELQVSV